MLLLQTVVSLSVVDQNRRRLEQKITRNDEIIAPRAGFEPTHPNWRDVSMRSEIDLQDAMLTVLDS